ncbi:unnamed protein product [Meganyctiphanes norvegica]|uniref:Uncharacterized protein n=1 Tax=Meganyctiphanes norvegica TaxID=48144 RepID=A0AAV2RRL5_MEGNR
MECCDYDNPNSPQLISVTKVDGDLGVYHSANFTKIICHNAKRNRFQIISRKKLQKMAKIRHPSNKIGHRGTSNDIIFEEEKFLKGNKKGYLNCLLSENMDGGWLYLNALQQSTKKSVHMTAKGKRVVKTSRPIKRGHRNTQFIKCSVGHACFKRLKKNTSSRCT